MFSIDDLRQRSRQALHGALSRPALYYPLERDAGTVGVPCTVRVHDHQVARGDMTGFDYDPAERVEIAPKIVFLNAEVTAERGGIFSISATEAYQVETVNPPDGITTTAQVSRQKQSKIDADTYSYPGAV